MKHINIYPNNSVYNPKSATLSQQSSITYNDNFNQIIQNYHNQIKHTQDDDSNTNQKQEVNHLSCK